MKKKPSDHLLQHSVCDVEKQQQIYTVLMDIIYSKHHLKMLHFFKYFIFAEKCLGDYSYCEFALLYITQ